MGIFTRLSIFCLVIVSLLPVLAPVALGQTPPDGKTRVAEKSEPSKKGYRVLERTKLSPYERKKLEKERADRIKNAEKALKAREEEYAGVDWAQRHKVRTQNFDVQCNSTRRVAELYGRMMELIRAKLAEMFPCKIQRNFRAPLFIYKNQDDFIARDPQARFGGRGLGGYYNPITQALTTYHGTFGFTGTTFIVLCHEGTHYYQGLVLKDFQNLPRWFIEGMAVYFGDGATFDAKTQKIEVAKIPRDRLAHIQEKMLRKAHTPIEKLITLPPNGFTGSHYADAWALIYFLARGSDKGEKLLQTYWTIGLEERLTKKHFLDLAQKYFGSVATLEKQYLEYILALEMPSAGKVIGDYYTSEVFQFDFKAPGDDWQFFEDPGDKTLIVGALRPGSSAEIRIYYDNNLEKEESETYFQKYLKAAGDRYGDLKHEKVKISNLDGYKLTYVEGGSPPAKEGDPKAKAPAEPGTPKEPGTDQKKEGQQKEKKEPPKEDAKKDKKEPAKIEPPKSPPMSIVKFLLIQVDGVVIIKCSADPKESGQLADLFGKANDLFSLSLTRRW